MFLSFPASASAVLIAGDNSLPVFQHAIEAVSLELRLADSPRLGPSVTLARVLGAVSRMHPSPGQGCFVFATSHGVRHEGFYLSRREEVLTPRALDRALLQGCGAAPTVVVISSCFSGSFAQAPMNRANRIILTAARADRTSFGCQAGRDFTVYDSCFLQAAGRTNNWHTVYDAVKTCVGAEERREDETPSEPQAWFGSDVSDAIRVTD